jgi:uncharacterized protein (DUF362 family)
MGKCFMKRNEIFVAYGNQPGKMLGLLWDKLDILDELPRDRTIGIKPNLVVSRPSHYGATTDPELVAGIIEYLQSNGFFDLIIMESTWLGDDVEVAFEVCGYREISRKFNVPLFNVRKGKGVRIRSGEMSIKVSKRATEVGYWINVPVLKAHCQTLFTCALKNMKGLVPDLEKRRFHALNLHKPIAYLNKIIRSDLVIVDGILGDLTHEEGGNPVRMNRIIAGRDPVLVDAYGATLIGYQPEEIEYLSIADEIGVGSSDLDDMALCELNSAEGSGFEIASANLAQPLKRYITQDAACSACYGSLLHALRRLADNRELADGFNKICVGQGFKGKEGPGIGVGVCTRELDNSLEGCPPTAGQIVRFLKKLPREGKRRD